MFSNLFHNPFIADGGPVQLILLGLSIITIVVTADQVFFSLSLLRKLKGTCGSFFSRMFSVRMESVFEAATEAAEIDQDSLAEMISGNIGFLALVAAVSPILGVLGTVHGIIVTFWGITGKENVQFADISLGISHALYTTAFGLIICLIAQLAIWVTERFVQRFTGMMVIESMNPGRFRN